MNKKSTTCTRDYLLLSFVPPLDARIVFAVLSSFVAHLFSFLMHYHIMVASVTFIFLIYIPMYMYVGMLVQSSTRTLNRIL